jgi:hypothetical protein
MRQLKVQTGNSGQILMRFKGEAKAASVLNYSNLGTVYDDILFGTIRGGVKILDYGLAKRHPKREETTHSENSILARDVCISCFRSLAATKAD